MKRNGTYTLDDLTIKEHLLELAEKGNKPFTESLNPGVEHVLGIRVPDLRKLAARIARTDWERFLETSDTFYMEERMLYGMVLGCIVRRRPGSLSASGDLFCLDDQQLVCVRHIQVRGRTAFCGPSCRTSVGISETMDECGRRI